MKANELFLMIRMAFLDHVPTRDRSGSNKIRHTRKAGPGRMPFRRSGVRRNA